MFRKKEKLEYKEYIKIFGPAIVLIIIGFIITYQFVSPAPPKNLVIATGSPEGAYYTYGNAYSKLLAREGITLEVKTTAGSLENLKLLETETGGVDIALLQGGMRSLAKTKNLASLASLYFEPVWIFHQTALSLKRFSDLKGLRVAVGLEGSGTKVLAMQLLGLNGITSENTQILSYGGSKAIDMLLNNNLDVAILVTTHRSAYIQKLLKSRSVKVMEVERAEAYALLYHYLNILKLPEGVIDFERNIPSQDLALIAPATQLVARTDLHPALINLFLQVAEEVHEEGDVFERAGEFPAPKYLDFELSEEAEQYYKSGPGFLQHYLPFWMAIFLKRMAIMLLPLLGLLYPFFKFLPLIYRWRMRSRIYRWYQKFEDIESDLQNKDLASHIDEYSAKLDRLEEKVSKISVPLAYAEDLYQLRLHIDMFRNRLHQVYEKKITAGELIDKT